MRFGSRELTRKTERNSGWKLEVLKKRNGDLAASEPDNSGCSAFEDEDLYPRMLSGSVSDDDMIQFKNANVSSKASNGGAAKSSHNSLLIKKKSRGFSTRSDPKRVLFPPAKSR